MSSTSTSSTYFFTIIDAKKNLSKKYEDECFLEPLSLTNGKWPGNTGQFSTGLKRFLNRPDRVGVIILNPFQLCCIFIKTNSSSHLQSADALDSSPYRTNRFKIAGEFRLFSCPTVNRDYFLCAQGSAGYKTGGFRSACMTWVGRLHLRSIKRKIGRQRNSK
jgi:hypothetical protein